MADEENTQLYKPTLVAFMSYNDRNDDMNDFVFKQDYLAEVDNADVVVWFNSKALTYQVRTPDQLECALTHFSTTKGSLAFYA